MNKIDSDVSAGMLNPTMQWLHYTWSEANRMARLTVGAGTEDRNSEIIHARIGTTQPGQATQSTNRKDGETRLLGQSPYHHCPRLSFHGSN